MKLKKLGIAPSLVVLVLVFGLAMLIGVILLMMYVRIGIEHSPEQTSIEIPARTLRLAPRPAPLDSGANLL
jgi:hypothetical protein